VDSTIYALVPTLARPKKYAHFTKAQNRAVVKFLEFVAAYGEEWCDSGMAKRALSEYWYEAARDN
jgi:uncharacterized protein DUF6714